MSPEFSRVRQSKGFAKHERRRKADDRKTAATLMQAQTPIETPPNPRLQAWKSMTGTIEKTFEDQPDLLTLFRRKKPFFREFFDGRYDISMGIGPTNFQAFVHKHLEDQNSPKYNPNLFDQAAPILRTITAETNRLSPAKRLGGIRK